MSEALAIFRGALEPLARFLACAAISAPVGCSNTNAGPGPQRPADFANAGAVASGGGGNPSFAASGAGGVAGRIAGSLSGATAGQSAGSSAPAANLGGQGGASSMHGSGGLQPVGGSSSSGGSPGSGGGAGGLGGRGFGGIGGAGASAQGGAGTVDCSGMTLSGGTAHCESNGSGVVGNYAWSIWSSGSGGCITPYGVGAAFKATWNNSGDFLAREGFQWDETKTYDQYGTLSADYAYTKTGNAGGYSYIGIYGWSNNPLIEYYIVDDWFGSGPPPNANGTLKGSLDVDGATYNIYTHTQTNQPSIHGTATFVQFFSIRSTPRQCGHISITEHFKKWASLGMTLGKMYEAKILIEAGGGNGNIDFTAASMTSQ